VRYFFIKVLLLALLLAAAGRPAGAQEEGVQEEGAQEGGPVKPAQPPGPETGQRVTPEKPEGATMTGVPRADTIADHRIGPFVVQPAIRAEFGYDSNVFVASDTGEKVSSRLFNAAGELRMILPGTSRHEFQFDGRLGYKGFLDQDSQSYTETSGEVVYRLTGDRNLIQIGDRYDVSRRRYSLEIDERVRFITNEVRGFWEYSLTSGFGLRFGAHHSDFKFASGATLGGVNLADQGNHQENGFELSGRIRLTRTVRVFGGGQYRRTSFQEADNPRDSTERTGDVGFEFSPEGAISGEAAVAYTNFRQQQLEEGSGSFSGLRARADLRIRLGDSAGLTISGQRAPQFSTLSASVLDETLRAILSFQASEDLIVSGNLEVSRLKYQGPALIILPDGSSFVSTRTDKGFGFGASAAYTLRPNWGIIGIVRRLRRNSDVQELDYVDNEALIGVQITL
jgi:hypothetical protein